MDKARGILKSCENFLVQTTAAMPAIMEEEEGEKAGAEDEKMDTGEQLAKVPEKHLYETVCIIIFFVLCSGGHRSKLITNRPS